MKEYTLSTNQFEMPKVLDGAPANYTLIMELLLLEPGTNQSHPDMGIGIRSRYLYSDTANITTLNSEIKNQMEKYIPQLLTADVQVSAQDTILCIFISTDTSETYGVGFNTQTGELKGLKLSDL